MDAARLLAINVFAALDAGVLEELAHAVEERALSAGDRVFEEGEPGDTLYAIAEGMVRIEKRIVASEAASKTLSLLTQGELFGEMSVIDSQPRSASAVAAEPTRLFCISRSAFEALLARNPRPAVGLLFSVMRAMNERVRRINTSVVAYDEIGRAIGASEQLTPLLELVLRQLLSATGAQRGLIFLQSEFHPVYESCGAAGVTSGTINDERPGDDTRLISRVAHQHEGWLVRDRAQDPRCGGLQPRHWETASMLLVPVTVATGMLGVLVLGHEASGRFDVNHLNLAEGIARQTAQAILNLRHREEQNSRARQSRQYVKF